MKPLNRSDGCLRPPRGPAPQLSHRSLLTRLALFAMILLLVNSPVAHGQQSKPSEYAVKAAYLYNFGRFVEWPDKGASSVRDSFSICVLGEDPFGQILGALAGQTIGGKQVVAKRISKPLDASNCRIVYISLSEEKQLNDTLMTLGKAGVLTVSDMPQFSQRGGMIQFVLDGNKVRFEINLTAAENAGLTLSSELLKVATAVRKSSQSGD
jgi:hypothetical protein